MNRKNVIITIFVSFLLYSNLIFAQYELKSKYLINPDLNIGFVDSCATFWLNAYDEINGGFYTNVSKEGNVLTNWGTNKDMITQSRNAYGLTRAYMLTGNDTYLEYAKKALDFMHSSAWDSINGGWYNSINKFGQPNNINEDKTAFNQHYALLGISAFAEAKNDSISRVRLEDAWGHNEAALWDPDEINFGYYDKANYNWSQLNGKSFNATVDALTTHLFTIYLKEQNEYVYIQNIQFVVDNILERLIPSMDDQMIGFAEEYNTGWSIKSNETMTIMGHLLKTAWCLGRAYHIDNNPEFIAGAEKIIYDVLLKGYDVENGGPYKDYNRVTGEMLMWGNPDTAKAWWQMEQAVVAGLIMYDITKEDKYLQMADETLDFFMNYFVDHIFGEVYENRTKYGEETWGEHKGNGFKAGYHSIELGYYAYLYSKLFLHNESISLYYNIEPGEWQTIPLNPLLMNLDHLFITSVELDGEEFANFSSERRELVIDKNIGGEFKVTFGIDTTFTFVEAESNVTPTFELSQNYPNPFNPITTIKYTIPSSSVVLSGTGDLQDFSSQSSKTAAPKNDNFNVRLTVFDILGREIETLVNENNLPGTYKVNFDASNLNSGVYFYSLVTGSLRDTKRMLLIK